MLHNTLFLLSSFFVTVNGNHVHDWDYKENGPDVWHEIYPTCGGQLQSPIDILTACTMYKNFTPFTFGTGYSQEHNFTLKNNGHTIVGTFNNEVNLPALSVIGGDVNGTLEFVNFHLHWGMNHGSGSEHEVNGAKYSGEIHFVYLNRITNQTAVIGIFMKSLILLNITEKISNPVIEQQTRLEWRKVFDSVQALSAEDNTIVLALNLKLLMGSNLRDFWRYEGSLTTPPCTQGIIWTIFREPIWFDEEEFSSFRQNITFEDYRRPQPLYGRSIYRNFLNETYSSVPDYKCCGKADVGKLPEGGLVASFEKRLFSMYLICLSLCVYILLMF